MRNIRVYLTREEYALLLTSLTATGMTYRDIAARTKQPEVAARAAQIEWQAGTLRNRLTTKHGDPFKEE